MGIRRRPDRLLGASACCGIVLVFVFFFCIFVATDAAKVGWSAAISGGGDGVAGRWSPAAAGDDAFRGSKRRIPKGPDPIHNRILGYFFEVTEEKQKKRSVVHVARSKLDLNTLHKFEYVEAHGNMSREEESLLALNCFKVSSKLSRGKFCWTDHDEVTELSSKNDRTWAFLITNEIKQQF
ncbi:hypothetical protein GUJ93_ZPchr0005g14494 [Zizania palustris]|uniref:Uncharacterized protein n=1 Tax=Zizania palustris TaxID=103762 RepID=A0A8J5SGH1_ZIZPA|nr:hypothetical protein GUJ93_ZPchr0005g14494 [Zizania palustris]